MKNTASRMKKIQGLITRQTVVSLVVVAAAAVLTGALGCYILQRQERAAGEGMLRTSARQLDERLESLEDGDWALNDRGELLKGGRVMEEVPALVDSLGRRTGLDYSVYFGRQQVASSSAQTEAASSAAAPDGIFSAVVVAGGELYDGAYYVPLKNPDGTTVGMIAVSSALSGTPAAGGILFLIAGCAGLFAIALILLVFSAGRARSQLAARSGQTDERFRRVIRNTREVSRGLYDSGADLADSAGLAATASGVMADKISEVTRGAALQAESVRSAADNTDEIRRGIEGLVAGADRMGDFVNEIGACNVRAAGNVDALAEDAAAIREAVEKIGRVILATQEMAGSIAQITQMIQGIASQTNLLSLNASIEASRAGEAGKGFVVVADEIRQLADESRKSAEEIQGLSERLISGSRMSAEAMKGLTAAATAHTDRLDEIRADMRLMTDSIDHLSAGAEEMIGQVDGLTERRNDLEEIIQDLAVLSDQNAASTEETTASMQELHETFTVISESAGQLQLLADDLQETVACLRV